jgi:G3E family GTPase
MIKIDIISGFLGAGKTTLIKRLLKTNLTKEKVVLVENEYGEIGIDAGFLKDTQINITELNEGCICCSLQGDFEVALNKLAKEYNPDRIIIEPSGVGKLSDIVKAVTDAKVPDSKINALVCLCDVTKAKMYLRNFGEFYVDQISHAKTVILSRTDVANETKVNEALEIIRSYNDHALIVTTPVAQLSDDQLIAAFEAVDDDFEAKLLEEVKNMKAHHHHHHHHDDEECDDPHCSCHHHHDEDDDEDEECEHHHHHHDDEECDDPHCSCHHDHDADEVFTSFGFDTAKTFDEETLKESLITLSKSQEYGTILRAKGYVNAGSNWIEFDLVPGQVDIRKTTPFTCGKICVIGSNVKKKDIKDLLLK